MMTAHLVVDVDAEGADAVRARVRAKRDAWLARAGMRRRDAMRAFVELLGTLGVLGGGQSKMGR